VKLLDLLDDICRRCIDVDGNTGLREALAMAQTADNVPPEKMLRDPPFLQVEIESSQAYMSVLLSIDACSDAAFWKATQVRDRISSLCMLNLERFERQASACQVAKDGTDSAVLLAENQALVPLAVATLKALLGLPKETFMARAKEMYPIFTSLIASDVVAQEVQNLLSEIFSTRISESVESL
jgi:hypothetical protein